ncbi:hypothetical protein KIN20_007653 [Parelaphostrongylus tenuis]|uniref:Uncharacterized protein n=1 Tax=Parelaphostrongylus tenuis TaxID=148309 RepID=A0AAD5MMI2_PARTN|nr:hypothetical protein KIN20_007653 [Parelaphostrongylus tenuis]
MLKSFNRLATGLGFESELSRAGYTVSTNSWHECLRTVCERVSIAEKVCHTPRSSKERAREIVHVEQKRASSRQYHTLDRSHTRCFFHQQTLHRKFGQSS